MEFESVVNKYMNSVYRAAYSITGNIQDAEDITQETFITYLNKAPSFESEEHRKAWLLRVAMNKAKNIMFSFWKTNRTSFEDIGEVIIEDKEESDIELLEAISALPKKCRMIIHLHYYEGYAVNEIAEILNVSENTVKTQLFRGRKILKDKLEQEGVYGY